MVAAKSYLCLKVLVFVFVPIASTPASPLELFDCSNCFACAMEVPQRSRRFPTDRFGSLFPPSPYHAVKDLIMPRKPLFSTRKPLFSTRKPLFSIEETPLLNEETPLLNRGDPSSQRGNPSSQRGNPSSQRGNPSTLLTTDPNPPPLSAFFPSKEAIQRSIDWEDELDTISLAGEVAARQLVSKFYVVSCK